MFYFQVVEDGNFKRVICEYEVSVCQWNYHLIKKNH